MLLWLGFDISRVVVETYRARVRVEAVRLLASRVRVRIDDRPKTSDTIFTKKVFVCVL